MIYEVNLRVICFIQLHVFAHGGIPVDADNTVNEIISDLRQPH